ncbi:MAG: hypothetical protein ACYDH9_14385 [Limisphaerales bacterium]
MKIISLIVLLGILAGTATAQDTPSARAQFATTNAPAISPPPTSKTGAAHDAAKSKVSPAAAKQKSALPVLGYLESRDRVVVIHPNHRYSVRTKDGKVLAAAVTVKKLRASFPDLYKLVNPSLASGASYPDARRWEQSPPSPLPNIEARGVPSLAR